MTEFVVLYAMGFIATFELVLYAGRATGTDPLSRGAFLTAAVISATIWPAFLTVIALSLLLDRDPGK